MPSRVQWLDDWVQSAGAHRMSRHCFSSAHTSSDSSLMAGSGVMTRQYCSWTAASSIICSSPQSSHAHSAHMHDAHAAEMCMHCKLAQAHKADTLMIIRWSQAAKNSHFDHVQMICLIIRSQVKGSMPANLSNNLLRQRAALCGRMLLHALAPQMFILPHAKSLHGGRC